MLKIFQNKESLFVFLYVFVIYIFLLPSNSIYLITPIRGSIFIILFILFCIEYPRRFINNTRYLWFFCLGFILNNIISYFTHLELMKEDLSYVIDVILIFIFCSISRVEQRKIFNLFVNWGAVYLIFALVEFILFNYLSTGILLASNIERGEGSTQFYSHGLLNIYQEGELITRFQALFREPGFLGVIAGLLMFSNNTLNKKSLIIWGISGLFSLSLAFYILLLLATLFHIFVSKKLFQLKYIIVLSCALIPLSILTYEVFNDAIIQRIVLYSQEGDNRTSDSLNAEIINMFDDGSWIWGKSNSIFEKKYGFGNAGLKAEIYKYGVGGIFIVIFFFIQLLKIYRFSVIDKFVITILFLLCLYNSDCKYSPYIYMILFSLFKTKNESTTYCRNNYQQLSA